MKMNFRKSILLTFAAVWLASFFAAAMPAHAHDVAATLISGAPACTLWEGFVKIENASSKYYYRVSVESSYTSTDDTCGGFSGRCYRRPLVATLEIGPNGCDEVFVPALPNCEPMRCDNDIADCGTDDMFCLTWDSAHIEVTHWSTNGSNWTALDTPVVICTTNFGGPTCAQTSVCEEGLLFNGFCD